MNDFAVKQSSPHNRASADFSRVTRYELGELTRDSVARLEIVGCAFRSAQDHGVGLAQPRRRLDERIEDCLQIEGRVADDLEHVSGGGLLLQRFRKLAGAL